MGDVRKELRELVADTLSWWAWRLDPERFTAPRETDAEWLEIADAWRSIEAERVELAEMFNQARAMAEEFVLDAG